jgi:hypothetical protein
MEIFREIGFMGCAICGKPLRLATAKSDNGELPIHEECNILRLKLKQATTPPSTIKLPSSRFCPPSKYD